METGSPQPRLILIAILAAIVLAVPARAFSVEIPSLVYYSDTILFGKTLSVSCQWAEDSPCILSRVNFQVQDCLRGNYRRGDVITIESQGGEINGMKQRVPNAPTFTKGKYALIFLNSQGNGKHSVTYGKEGMIPCSKKGKGMVASNGKPLVRLIKEVKQAMNE